MNIKATIPSTFVHVLALKTPRRHGDIEVDSDAVLRHLVVWLRRAGVPPVHAGVARAVAQHEAQRLGRLRVVRAAVDGRRGGVALGQVAAEVAGGIAGGVALLGVALAEDGLGRDDDVALAAVEEEVLVALGEGEVRAGVEAEGARGAEAGAVAAAPHGGVGDEDVGVGAVDDGAHRVAPRGRSQLERARLGADEEVAVIGAAAAVVDAERVAYGDLAA